MSIESEIRDAVLAAVDWGAFSPDDEQVLITPYQRMSAVGHCKRQQTYALHAGAAFRTPHFDAWELRDGDVHEADLKHWFRRAGYTITNEQDELKLVLSDGHVVPGHPDGVIVGPLLDMPHLFEAKAMSFMRFASVSELGVKQSNYDYYLQLNEYMAAMDLKAALFAAKAKDSSGTKRMIGGAIKRIREGFDPKNPERDYEGRTTDIHHKLYLEIVPFDPAAYEDAMARHEEVRAAHKAGILLEREYNGPGHDWNCDTRFCPFSRHCYPAYGARNLAGTGEGDDPPE